MPPRDPAPRDPAPAAPARVRRGRRASALTYDRGTLLLHPPPPGRSWVAWAVWDDRVERFRVRAPDHRALLEAARAEGVEIVDRASAWEELRLEPPAGREPWPHQRDALEAWEANGRRGVVVLPTGAGKTHVAELALARAGRSALIVVPTLDLMQQWYSGLLEAFPGAPVGLLGGGSRDETPILVATYDSAAIHAERLGARYALLVFDEAHHLPGSFTRSVAEASLAPWRLGLTATPERSDGLHSDLDDLIGPVVLRRRPEELAGGALAPFDVERIVVALSAEERARYDELLAVRAAFLRSRRISLASLEGWQRFVRASASSPEGRAAMLAHREARELAFGTSAKLRALEELLERHADDRVLVFTHDNATVHRVSRRWLLPAITHQTPVKERHEALERFRDGRWPRLVASRVLNEGVDVPDANVAVVLSGTGSHREHVQRLGRVLRRREGKRAVLYEVVSEGTAEERVADRRRDLPGAAPAPAPARERPARSGLELEPIPDDDDFDFDDL